MIHNVMDKTLYVVSGFMRTGTSMMMKALEAGGMNACYRESKDELRDRHIQGSYNPNEGGLYELEDQDYKQWDFPRGYSGKLIKSLNTGVTRFAVMPEGIRVVFMKRNPIEIQASFIKFFGKELRRLELYERNMNDIIERIENRKDVKSISVLEYDLVLQCPSRCFSEIRESGWPIDVDSASAVVDPALRHCDVRIEETINRLSNVYYPTLMIGGTA